MAKIYNEPNTRRLAQEELDAYVADPNHCPFCKADDISAGFFDGEAFYREVNCNVCGVYTLTSVEPVYGEEDMR
jgi:transcription elongation factor Elf1